MSYKLNFESGAAVIPLSALKKIPECKDPEDLRALCLLVSYGLASRDFDTVAAEIARDGHMTEEKLRLAAAYWHGSGALTVSGGTGEMRPISARQNERLATGAEAETLTSEKICRWMDSDERLGIFVKSCEDIYGAILNPTEITVILTFLKEYHLSDESIFMVLGYCHDNGYSITYAKMIFTRLVDNEITTVEGTRAELAFIASHNAYSTEVKAIFGINRAFTKAEEKTVEKWQKQYAFTPEVIRMAFEHSVGSGKTTVNIKYCDKVLIDWREKNLVSAEEIRAFLDKKKEDYKKLAKGTKPEENSSFSTDDFFDAAIKRSYKKKNG